MKSQHDWIEAADYIDYTLKVSEAAKGCGADRWAVVQISTLKAALFTGDSVNLIPQDMRSLIISESE